MLLLKRGNQIVDGNITTASTGSSFGGITDTSIANTQVVYSLNNCLSGSSNLTYNGTGLSTIYRFTATGTGDASGNALGFLFSNTYGGSGKQWAISVDNSYSKGLNFVESGVADGRIFIKPGGNVGIGTTNPSTKLNVDGTINTNTNFSVQGIQGKTGNYSNGNCWMKFTGGILTATNCSNA